MKLIYKIKQRVLEVLVKSRNYIEGVHYYKEGDRVVFTALFHLERGNCCGNGCKHCPYEPLHKHGNTVVQDKYLVTKEEIDIFKLKKGYASKTHKRNS
jgi:2-iminoacetate synthase ThiH